MCRFPDAAPTRLPQAQLFAQQKGWKTPGASPEQEPGSPASQVQVQKDDDEGIDELLFPIELDETSPDARDDSDSLAATARNALRTSSTAEDAFCSQLRADAQRILRKIRKRNEEGPSTIVADLGKALCRMKYKVSIRSSLPLKKKTVFSSSGFKPVSNTNPECLKILQHSFLMVEQVVLGVKGKPLFSREVVVEPDFKHHFMIPVGTPRYDAALAQLPETFVGGRAQLRTLVMLMSKEIQLVFTQHGRVVPPWRQFIATWSKWSPKRFEVDDIVMDAKKAVLKKRQDSVGKQSKKWKSKSMSCGSQEVKPITGFEATSVA